MSELEKTMNPGPWNSLEVAKLLTGLLTPAVLALLGIYIHRVTKRFEHLQWRSQKLVAKRLAIYDDLSPLLNDLLCYFTYVGLWKELDPPKVVSLKRVVDKKVHLAAPLFSESVFRLSMEFQALCFEPYTGWGQDALLRTQFERRKEARSADWQDGWDKCFSVSPSDPGEIRHVYLQMPHGSDRCRHRCTRFVRGSPLRRGACEHPVGAFTPIQPPQPHRLPKPL
jgi:hypothetical protein